MRLAHVTLLGIGFLGFGSLAGCCCHNCDLVEAELRSREEEVRELRAQLLHAEANNEAAQRELHGLHHSAASPITPELAAQIFKLKEIVLGRQTGGYDDDDRPGDEALQVVLEPRDPDGHTIKVPGTLHVMALEIGGDGSKKPLSTWDVTPEQLSPCWRSGLLSTGFFVVLPWQTWPSSGKMRVVARFQLADGRMFEAEKDVTVRVAPPAYRKTAPSSTPRVEQGPPPTPVPAPKDASLPAPRKLEPGPVPGNQIIPKDPEPGSGLNPALSRQPSRPAPVFEAIQVLRPVPLGE